MELEGMIAAAYVWAERKRKGLSVTEKPMGIREAKREAIRQALLIPGISQRGVAELTSTCNATVQRVVRDQKRAMAATA